MKRPKRNSLSCLLLSLALVSSFGSFVLAQSQIENPPPGSHQSGVGLISGWKCTGENLTAIVDGVYTFTLPYGSQRHDTQGFCGDMDNGFGLLVNWNLLADGVHTLRLYDNGKEFASATFTVQTLGEQFRKGLSKTIKVENFPSPGQTTLLEWQETSQNFVISHIVKPADDEQLRDLFGHWEFVYTTSSLVRDRFHLYFFDVLPSGIPFVEGIDEEDGLTVVAARTADLISASLPYEFLMIDLDPTSCDLFVFNKTGANIVQGQHLTTPRATPDGCSLNPQGNAHALVGARTPAVLTTPQQGGAAEKLREAPDVEAVTIPLEVLLRLLSALSAFMSGGV